MKKLKYGLASLLIIYIIATFVVPPLLDKSHNQVTESGPYTVSDKAQAIYNDLDFISDLHCDALLWDRDLTQRADYGQVDFPRMEEAGMALQAFTIVTKSPKGQNFRKNSSDALDNITLLTVAQGQWPDQWFSLYKRAAHQSRQLSHFAKAYHGTFIVVKNQKDLNDLILARKQNPKAIGGFLGVEGAHCLEGELGHVQDLYDEGVRMMAATHFFDNELGGSAHGISGEGLTDFGKAVIDEMDRLGMIIDLAHISPAMIDDILDRTQRPVLVSHTGVKGTKDSPRNLSDAHVKRIAEKGGLIGIAFFNAALGKKGVKGIVEAMTYVKDLVGVEHVALGSDFDGDVTTPFDVTGLPLLVEEMWAEGFSEVEIAAIMGGNVKRFLETYLPAE